MQGASLLEQKSLQGFLVYHELKARERSKASRQPRLVEMNRQLPEVLRTQHTRVGNGHKRRPLTLISLKARPIHHLKQTLRGQLKAL